MSDRAGPRRGRVAASDGYRCGWLHADGRYRRQRKRGAQAGLDGRKLKRRSPTGEQPGATTGPGQTGAARADVATGPDGLQLVSTTAWVDPSSTQFRLHLKVRR